MRHGSERWASTRSVLLHQLRSLLSGGRNSPGREADHGASELPTAARVAMLQSMRGATG